MRALVFCLVALAAYKAQYLIIIGFLEAGSPQPESHQDPLRFSSMNNGDNTSRHPRSTLPPQGPPTINPK
ncbi:Protein of unknown function [Cotesia congregata]|uniref:Uncharacterized protein n=1 Tax=Cotesia congregata TaxID=51543 RepID=A0A8J2HLX8_COTCN|nr:Protein of unknown function [Cotesia congregata]